MKITKLRIKGYKNLDIDIEHHSDVITFVGLNGSGKSNVLEAVAYIFGKISECRDNNDMDYSRVLKAIKFEFEIHFIPLISIDNTNKNYITVSNQGMHCISNGAIDESFSGHEYEVLPDKIVAIYSGEEKRLWTKFFKPSFDEYIKQLSAETRLKPQRMIFLSRKHWDISLLMLLISELQDVKDFVKNILKIESVDKIEFKFNQQRYKSWKPNLSHTFVKNIDYQNEYSLSELQEKLSDFNKVDIFSHLYNALLSEMITEIQITFNNNLTLSDFSEGEKKLLLLKAAFEFVAQEGSLFLLDEPDSHIHLNNKPQIISIINQYKHNRQFILTTHSPTLTQCIKETDNDNQDRVYVLDNGKNIDVVKTKEIDYLAGEFWNTQQQTAFLSTKKNVILLVEGKHDKSHILNAWKHYKDDYQNLDFDIFVMDGADNITHMITGLRKSDNVDKTKIYIGIVDNDESGRNCRKDSDIKYPENNKVVTSGFMTILYPEPDGFTKKDKNKENDYTVENLLPIAKYEEVYKEIVCSYEFTAKKIDNISKEIQEGVKGMLASKSKDFTKADFIEFKNLFDTITKIVNLNAVKLENINNTSTQLNTQENPAEDSNIKIFNTYNGNKYEAYFNKNTKKVTYDGVEYDTANKAMFFVRHGKSGVQAGKFWKYQDNDGGIKHLDNLPDFKKKIAK